uniref:Ankyrin repeat domain-containing protein 26 n=1 Tax=Haemonchus placei TaxID=6290 RepID=A0A0N4WF89_HAEPC
LATQRQLYVSNEETMRAKELEHRSLKAKIMSAELHLREKDSKISQMTVCLSTILFCRLNDVLSELEQTKRLLEDSRRQHQKQKEQLERLMYEERHWKQAVRNCLQLSYTNQLRNNLSQQVAALQKAEREWSKLEREMRDELVGLRRDKLVLTSEVEELKRKLVRAEVEKKELDGIRARLEREVASLKKHVEALEEEKTRTDAAVRNTLSERKAIDKSLAAMEKENSELYRNCAQLQSQIAQLERDAGSKNVAKLLKDHSEMETRISKLTVEKRQVSVARLGVKMNFTHKRKLLESQLSLLRDQLEAERKRRAAAGPVATLPSFLLPTFAFTRPIHFIVKFCPISHYILEEFYCYYEMNMCKFFLVHRSMIPPVACSPLSAD